MNSLETLGSLSKFDTSIKSNKHISYVGYLGLSNVWFGIIDKPTESQIESLHKTFGFEWHELEDIKNFTGLTVIGGSNI